MSQSYHPKRERVFTDEYIEKLKLNKTIHTFPNRFTSFLISNNFCSDYDGYIIPKYYFTNAKNGKILKIDDEKNEIISLYNDVSTEAYQIIMSRPNTP